MTTIKVKTATGWQDLSVASVGPGALSVPIEPWRTFLSTGGFYSSFSGHATSAPSFRKTPDGRVQLRGWVQSTGFGFSCQVVLLPVGYRPSVIQRFICMLYDPAAVAAYQGVHCYIDTDGILVMYGNLEGGTASGASGSILYLDGIEFPTDQSSFPTGSPPLSSGTLWLPPGVVAETYPRAWTGSTGQPVSGTLRLMAITVPANTQIRRAMLVAATTVTAPTNQWVCLVRPSDLAVLTKSNNKLTEAWAQNQAKTFDGLSYDVGLVDEALYLGYVITASTMPNFPLMVGHAGLNTVAPMPSATSTTGLTTPASLGATAAALTSAAGFSWGAVMTA